jgi:hypothetical protein
MGMTTVVTFGQVVNPASPAGPPAGLARWLGERLAPPGSPTGRTDTTLADATAELVEGVVGGFDHMEQG